ncbi:plasmid recombination protein, partial [Staphylococcus simulans]
MAKTKPHMHVVVVPITEGVLLSAKDVIGNTKGLTELKDRFNEYINICGYDLARGLTRGVK